MLWLLLACTGEDVNQKASQPDDTANQQEVKPDPVYLTSGPPKAGVAEAVIDFPVGTPLGGYTSRCGCLGGGDAKVDNRQSAYSYAFSTSAGIQTSPMAKVLWLEAGNQHLVIFKVDTIYSYDNLVENLEDRLQAATNLDLDGKVIISTSHTHSAPSNYSDQIHFYLGGDRYNEEIFQRFATTLETIGLEAFNSREDASIGFSVQKDWDPEDNVYRDRRPENDSLAVWDDVAPGFGKDPYLWMLRVDTLAGEPLGMFFRFGIHGTSLGGGNPMISTDVTGHIEYALQEQFDKPIVISHMQGAGGDTAPAGNGSHGHDFAVMEGIGEMAVNAVFEQWEQTPVSNDAFSMEAVSRSIPEGLEKIKVTRKGTVDWHYQPFDEDYEADDIVYDADGKIVSPLDEFNAQYGAAFCGSADPLISAGTIGATAFPYNACMQVDLVSYVINGIFSMNDFWEDGGVAPLPLPSSEQAGVTTVRMGPVHILREDGTQHQDDLLLGFFPGEITGMYAEQFTRRADDELGFQHVLSVGYAQDHEGYLMIPEDWLLGGLESTINIWGPLQGEHIMEGALQMSDEHLHTDEVEPLDPNGQWQPTSYPIRQLPAEPPDLTPAAGTALTDIPDDFYLPLDVELQLEPLQQVRRVQDLYQFAWEGGDPGVDRPHVILETLVDGTWTEVLLNSGRTLDATLPDILLAHNPSPLYPYYDPQSHYWWLAWQAVGFNGDRTGLPVGTYRFHIYGQSYAGGAETWPWPTEDYEITTPEFEVIPADLQLQIADEQLIVSLPAPTWGFRLIDLDGSSQGNNPPSGLVLSWQLDDGSQVEMDDPGSLTNGTISYPFNPPENAIQLIAIDMYGNYGELVWGDE